MIPFAVFVIIHLPDKIFNNIFSGKSGKPTGTTSETIVKNTYWRSKAYKIAHKGIFTKQGLTPLDSVYNTNMYQVLEFISIETAEETYKAELQQQAPDFWDWHSGLYQFNASGTEREIFLKSLPTGGETLFDEMEKSKLEDKIVLYRGLLDEYTGDSPFYRQARTDLYYKLAHLYNSLAQYPQAKQATENALKENLPGTLNKLTGERASI